MGPPVGKGPASQRDAENGEEGGGARVDRGEEAGGAAGQQIVPEGQNALEDGDAGGKGRQCIPHHAVARGFNYLIFHEGSQIAKLSPFGRLGILPRLVRLVSQT